MKMIMFLLTVSFLQSAFAGYGQEISIQVNNAPIKKVLYNLSKESGYDFIYETSILTNMPPLTLNLNKVSLKEALDKCFEGQSIEFYFTENNTAVIKKRELNKIRSSQQKTIEGTVKGDNETLLQGVSVLIKNTQKGTATNKEGVFYLEAKEGDTLVFKYVGFETKEYIVGEQDNLEIVLFEIFSDLDEVVVVGMGNKQSRRSITGAVSTIETKELKQSPVANLSNALAGRLPGLITVQTSGEPGNDGSTMYIRGIGTYGNTGPLVVIDGLPRSSHDFAQLDANEVESITILKDAASSALYGIQAANGVVVVTTRRGGTNKTPEINVNIQSAVQQPVRLPSMMNSYDQALYYQESDFNNQQPVRFTDEVLEIIENGSQPFLYPNVNWFDVLLKDAATQTQYNANISGSSNNVRYFISGSYIGQETLLKHGKEFEDNYGLEPKFDRYNFRSNVDVDATSMLHLQVDLAGRLENQVYPSSGFGYIFNDISARSPAAQPVFNPDGTLGAGSLLEVPYRENPYGLATRNGYFTGYANTMSGTLSAKHDLDFVTKGLAIQTNFSFLNSNYKSTTRRQNFDSYWYQGEGNDGEPIYQQDGIKSFLSTSGSSSIERHNYLDLRLTYDTDFGKHATKVQILANRTLRITNDELPYAYQGVSGHFTYNYNLKYFAAINIGYNGSENFPADRRYGIFPAFSAGWIMSDENFLRDIEWLNFLKLRGSHGYVGNDKIGGARWLYISDFAPGGGFQFGNSPIGAPGYNESRVGNEYVTWERSAKSNIGIDLAILRNREIEFNFDIFREERKNILTAPGSVPSYVGIVNLSARNSGVVLNKGFEAELKLNKTFGEVRLFSNFQITHSENEVLQNDQPVPEFLYQDLRGYSVGYVLGYQSLGLFRNQEDIDNSPPQNFSEQVIPGDIKYLDYNMDGVIDYKDRVPIQLQNMPRYVAGMSLGGSYRGLDFSVLLNGAWGGTSYVSMYPGSPLYLDRWTQDNIDTQIPVAHASGNNSNVVTDHFIQETDYLKIRNVEIGYTLPENILNRFQINRARIYLNGQNLHTWDKLWLKDRDPETSSGGALNYPILRIINIGLNVNF